MKGEARIAPADQRHLQIQVQRVHGVRKDQRLADVIQRRLQKVDDPVAKEPADKEARSQIECGVDDALAQLVQMLHQAHAGQFRALAHCRARLADCVGGVNHVGSAPPRPVTHLLWARPKRVPGFPRLLLSSPAQKRVEFVRCPGLADQSALQVMACAQPPCSPVEGG